MHLLRERLEKSFALAGHFFQWPELWTLQDLLLKHRWVLLFIKYFSSWSFQNISCHCRSYDFDQALTYFC